MINDIFDDFRHTGTQPGIAISVLGITFQKNRFSGMRKVGHKNSYYRQEICDGNSADGKAESAPFLDEESIKTHHKYQKYQMLLADRQENTEYYEQLVFSFFKEIERP
jgi:hypothetical protein